jgi:hypothetical protein
MNVDVVHAPPPVPTLRPVRQDEGRRQQQEPPPEREQEHEPTQTDSEGEIDVYA